MREFWQHVEAKVKAAALGAFCASLVAAVLNALLNGSAIPATPHAWVQFIMITCGPTVVSFLAAHAAPHQPIPPVPTTKTSP
jgi:hypothetical protein